MRKPQSQTDYPNENEGKIGIKKNEVITLEEKDNEDPIKSYIPPLPILKEKGIKEKKPISRKKSQKINDELYISKSPPKIKENGHGENFLKLSILEPNSGKIFTFLSINELFSESTTMDQENAELSEERKFKCSKSIHSKKR